MTPMAKKNISPAGSAFRHDEIHEADLRFMESVAERLPFQDASTRKELVGRILTFLDHHVAADARREQARPPLLAGAHDVERSVAHRAFAQSVRQLAELARCEGLEPRRFRHEAFEVFARLRARRDAHRLHRRLHGTSPAARSSAAHLGADTPTHPNRLELG